jgi:hypothetical protein
MSMDNVEEGEISEKRHGDIELMPTFNKKAYMRVYMHKYRRKVMRSFMC